jgi:hypothetical protein
LVTASWWAELAEVRDPAAELTVWEFADSEVLRPVIPTSAVGILEPHPGTLVGRLASELLQEVANAAAPALLLDFGRPLKVEKLGIGTAFAPDDHPIDPAERELKGLTERFH